MRKYFIITMSFCCINVMAGERKAEQGKGIPRLLCGAEYQKNCEEKQQTVTTEPFSFERSIALIESNRERIRYGDINAYKSIQEEDDRLRSFPQGQAKSKRPRSSGRNIDSLMILYWYALLEEVKDDHENILRLKKRAKTYVER